MIFLAGLRAQVGRGRGSGLAAPSATGDERGTVRRGHLIVTVADCPVGSESNDRFNTQPVRGQSPEQLVTR